MKNERQFEIQFASLEVGSHEFALDIEEDFFQKLNSAEINSGSLKVNVELMKADNLLVLEFKIDGSVKVECDRCADILELPISGSNRLIVKFGVKVYEETDEIIVISEKENTIDVAPYVFECIHLQLPQRKVHDEGDCDTEAIERLNGLEGKTQDEETIDPRWEALKKIKLDA